MKRIYIMVGLLAAIFTAHAQIVNCDQIKAENTRLRAEIVALKGGAASTTNTSLATVTDEANKIDFRVASVTGSRKSQMVTVVVVVTNRVANRSMFNSDIRSFTDAQGEEYKLMDYKYGADKTMKNLMTEAPLKVTYVFGGILSSVAKITSLPYPYSFNKNMDGAGYTSSRIEFRDLTITWK